MSDHSLPEDCGYNKIYKHVWKTYTHALPLSAVTKISSIVTKRWGWHFTPHKDMNYHSETWYEKQTMCLSFESKIDLILVKLMVDVK